MSTGLGAVESIVRLIAVQDSPSLRQCRAAVDAALGARTDERDLLAYACAQLLAARTARIDPAVTVPLRALEDRLADALAELRRTRAEADRARAAARTSIADGAAS